MVGNISTKECIHSRNAKYTNMPEKFVFCSTGPSEESGLCVRNERLEACFRMCIWNLNVMCTLSL